MANKDYPVYADYAAAAAAVGFPSSVLTPWELFDKSVNRDPLAVAFSVPAGLSRVAPVFLGIPVVTVGGNARTVVRGTGPASGQVGYDDVMGILYFHSTDAAGSCVATGAPLMTVRVAGFLHRLQAELIAAEAYILGLESTGRVNQLAVVTGVSLQTAGVRATVTVPVGQTGALVAVRARVTSIGAVMVWPVCRVDVAGVGAFAARELREMAMGYEMEWSGAGMRPALTAGAAIQFVVETAANAALVCDIEVEWKRRT